MKSFNQPFAASIILKHLNKMQLHEEYLLLDLIYNIVEATFFQFKSDGKVDNVTQSYILFSYTNSCYFIFNWFDKDKEGILHTQLLIEGDKANKSKIEEYFSSTIEDILSVPQKNFLKLDPQSVFNCNLTDLTVQFKIDIVNGLINLKEKDRLFTQLEMKEFLMYYTFILLITLVKTQQVSFNYQVVDVICSQVERACEEIVIKLHYNYEQVNPKEDILNNIDNALIPELAEKYLGYAF
jgi:hypothetical protein